MLRLTVAIAVVGVALLSGVPARRYNQGAISEGMNVQATGGNLGPEKHSCSTFLLPAGDTLLVGHNVDDDYVIPGAVVVNKRGVQKESTSWEADLLTLFGRSHKPSANASHQVVIERGRTAITGKLQFPAGGAPTEEGCTTPRTGFPERDGRLVFFDAEGFAR